jgi:hypothetical protein
MQVTIVTDVSGYTFYSYLTNKLISLRKNCLKSCIEVFITKSGDI